MVFIYLLKILKAKRFLKKLWSVTQIQTTMMQPMILTWHGSIKLMKKLAFNIQVIKYYKRFYQNVPMLVISPLNNWLVFKRV